MPTTAALSAPPPKNSRPGFWPGTPQNLQSQICSPKYSSPENTKSAQGTLFCSSRISPRPQRLRSHTQPPANPVAPLWKFQPFPGPQALPKSPHLSNPAIQARFLEFPKVFLVSALICVIGGRFFWHCTILMELTLPSHPRTVSPPSTEKTSRKQASRAQPADMPKNTITGACRS